MAPMIATIVLAVELLGGAPKTPPVKRNPFSRLGRAIRRAASVEPALAMRFSSIGISDPDKKAVEAPAAPARSARKSLRQR